MLGLTTQDLAELVGVKRGQVNRMETGERKVGPRARKLATALGVHWFWLMTGQQPGDRTEAELLAIAPLPWTKDDRDALLFVLMERHPLARARWLASQANCNTRVIEELRAAGRTPPSFLGWSYHQGNQALRLSRWTYDILVGEWMREVLDLHKEVGPILGHMRRRELIEPLEPEWLRPHQLAMVISRPVQSRIYGLTRAGKLARKALLETQP